MAEKQYQKYIITEPDKDYLASLKTPKSIEEQREAGSYFEGVYMFHLDDRILPGGFYTDCHWITAVHGNGGVQTEIAHTHDFGETLGFVGSVLTDPRQLGGEIEALQMISEGNPSAVVIIALSPVRKTTMENVHPPSPENIGRITSVARLGFPDIPLLLGCARPMGQHKIDTDKFAIRSGVNGIAMISQEGVDFARALGLKPTFEDVCCSLAYQTLV